MVIAFFKRLFGGGPAGAAGAPAAAAPATSSGPRLRTYKGSELGIHREQISQAAIRTCEILQRAGFKAYVVGGGVRDSLLGLTPKDFDVATDATPEQVQASFRRARIIGRRFKIVHVMFGRETIETSTFRALQNDAETDEHGRVLRDNVFGTQQEDALRRDFTVNALYYDPIADQVQDWLGGVADLKARTLRMIGDPATRYREDPVRMLRTVRFAAKLDFHVDPATLAPIAELAELLENVPSARLFDEMLKLLESGHALACVRRLRAEGLHHGVLPLLDVIVEQPDGERFIEVALANTDARVRAGKSVSPGFLFATLLWQLVSVRWRARQAAGEHSIPALMEAMDSVLDEQASKLAIQRRYIADMRDIWGLQPRLEKGGRGAARALEHLRFRAGYDFLLLRVEAGELPEELGRWWTDFVDGDSATREQLLDARPGDARPAAATKRRRRRRSGARKGAGEGDAAGDAGGEGVGGEDGGTVGREPDDDPRWREIPGQGGGSPRDRDPPA
ncbi:MAG: polynucleotide adenylyltransferase PcnB [Burkholderiales bacterium]|nr:polynucleotide adenylyltransferase PcnB [Burkholderiales bacterium]